MIIDNKQHGRAGDVLKQSLTSNADVSIMTNRFSIFAYQEMRREFSSLNSLRILLSNPFVLIMNSEDHMLLSLSPKRINRADNTKRTIESSISTDWIDTKNLGEFETLFLESLSLSSMSYENLYKLYEAIIERISALQSSKYVSAFTIPIDGAAQRLGLDQIASLQRRMSECRNRLKKADQFNEKMQITIEIKEIEKQIDLAKQGLLWKN